jgi:glutamate-1-semialdehyde 2,1-aminomutase
MTTDTARGLDLLPGRRVHAVSFPDGRVRVMSRGLGARVWDNAGCEYVDFLLGSGPLVVGHAHPLVVEAVARQAALGITFYTPTEPVLALAERIVDAVPCAEMVQFCASGSEATHYALRIARAATGRDAVLKFEGGFHGSNDYALMSLFPVRELPYPRAEPSSAGIPPALAGEVLVAPFNDLATTAALVEAHAIRLAAIIVEPMQRVIPPVPGFLAGLRELASRHGIVLVFDEVVTGFRFGPDGAQGRYGVTPDLTTLGKVIGGGFPLAAVTGRRDLLARTDSTRRGHDGFVYMSGTLNGNPVAAAAGLATLDTLDREDGYRRLEALGQRARLALRMALSDTSLPVQVLGEGPLFQIVVAGHPVTDYRSMAAADTASVKRLAADLFEEGWFFTGDKAYLSTAHSDADIDRFAERAAAAAGRRWTA